MTALSAICDDLQDEIKRYLEGRRVNRLSPDKNEIARTLRKGERVAVPLIVVTHCIHLI